LEDSKAAHGFFRGSISMEALNRTKTAVAGLQEEGLQKESGANRRSAMTLKRLTAIAKKR
jgi:hypothetical protein